MTDGRYPMDAEMTGRPVLPPFARVLGFAGLLPQAAAVAVLILGGPDVRFAALSLAYAYAALIFSFLGGVWWGLAAMARGGATRPWRRPGPGRPARPGPAHP
ncbi:hypothetical protein BBAL3_1403 [Brevundimonas sp. BAL3]|jgi:hypothetical protein|nr:hypothetical protein BBAL3_1403 [Brevundimonas sp. BAL3]